MQKISTRVFIYSSIVFGVIGLLAVFTLPAGGDVNSTPFHTLLMKLLFATIFVILPSFALSIASKYLKQ